MFACLSVCLFVCWQNFSKSYKQIAMKFYGRVQCGNRTKWLDFESDPDHNPALLEVCALRVLGIRCLSVDMWWRRCFEYIVTVCGYLVVKERHWMAI